ncbi:MAG: aminoacyl-tRNA hydrolase [bacterium]|nr:aminoacyl-tRNA hydrolase [bacterium]
MKLIIGLGNPGSKYENTRHNIGFMAVEKLLRDLAPVEKSRWELDGKTKAELAKLGEILLAKPQTFMNAAGFAVAKLVNFYKVESGDIWVIHDDLDLPLGKIKIRQDGGAAGHHGLESIIEKLGATNFVRFRLGVGRPKGHDAWEKLNVKRREVEKYVLSEFSEAEEKEVGRLIKKASEAVQVALKKGLEAAMNRFNG